MTLNNYLPRENKFKRTSWVNGHLPSKESNCVVLGSSPILHKFKDSDHNENKEIQDVSLLTKIEEPTIKTHP
jgi:hypothetical protein